jgi:hypothetical protein
MIIIYELVGALFQYVGQTLPPSELHHGRHDCFRQRDKG